MDSEEEILMEEAGGRRRPGSDLGRSKGRGEPHLWRCSAGGGGAGGRDESLQGEKRERGIQSVWGGKAVSDSPEASWESRLPATHHSLRGAPCLCGCSSTPTPSLHPHPGSTPSPLPFR